MSETDSDWTAPEAWLVVFEIANGSTHIDPADEGALDAAVSRYLDSGGTRDELLCLTLSEGGTYRVRASQVSSWYLSTPDHVRHNLIRTHAQRENDRAIRTSMGLPWKEDDD